MEKSKSEILQDMLKKQEAANAYGFYNQYDFTFLPRRNVKEEDRFKSLPNGVYEAKVVGLMQQITFTAIDISSDELLRLPDSPGNKVINDVREFFKGNAREKMKKKGLSYKRGTLLEGPPGVGKTATLGLIVQELKNEAVILFNPDVHRTLEYLRCIHQIEPNKPIIVIWEEFDSLIDRRSESELLSLLDGQVSVENVYYLTTTNYISKIPARIKNRPSRFANIIHLDKPSKEDRRLYLESKLTEPDEQHLIPILLDQSKGFVIDQLKDLIVSVCCFGVSVPDAVRKIKEMNDEGVGFDDFEEDNAKSVFKSKLDSKKPISALDDEDDY